MKRREFSNLFAVISGAAIVMVSPAQALTTVASFKDLTDPFL